MKAMLLNRYGPDAAFEETEVARPEAGPGEVLVKVEASSVNTVDTMIRQLGTENLPFAPSLPALLGMDFAGTIVALGDGVQGYREGDEVYGCAGGLAQLPGSLAQYMSADVRLLAKKPSSLSMREAAALPLVGITALEGLTRANLKAGQKVLVHGGAGGVGHVAVQLARQAGADVYATGGNEQSLKAIESYGATAINYRESTVEDYVARYTDGKGFDLVYDSVGGDNMNASFEAAALNAQVVTTVSMVELDLTPAHFKGLSLHVVFMLIPMLHDYQREQHSAILQSLAERADAGDLKPLLDAGQFSLAEVGDAYARLESGAALGKVVIDHL